MPVSGAQHHWLQEVLQGAVHSMYRREGLGPASTGRTVAVSSRLSGSLSGQSPQNVEPPAFRAARSWEVTGAAQTSLIDAVRASPRTRLPYGSAHPHTRRPSHNIQTRSEER